MDKLVLTDEQKVIVSKLSAEEKKAFDTAKPMVQLAFIKRIEVRVMAVEGEEFTTGDMELEEIPLLSPITDTNPLGFHAGEILKGRLIGYVNMFSPEHKENWDKIVCKITGEVFYKNGYFKFQANDGSFFGIRDASALHKLRKVATTVTPVDGKLTVSENPMVAVKYEGKLTKADALKRFGFEIKQGKEAHIYTYSMPDAVILYTRGIVNQLNPASPISRAEDNRDIQLVNEANYEAQVIAHERVSQAKLLDNNTAQIQ